MDVRVSGAIITASECCALLGAMIIVLSMIGVNVNALLLPAGIALAYAAKDLSHNFLAGQSHLNLAIKSCTTSCIAGPIRCVCCYHHDHDIGSGKQQMVDDQCHGKSVGRV